MTEPTPRSQLAFEQVLAFDTPENVVFGYLVAGIGSRFLAALVDTVLISMLQVIANLTLLFLVTIVAGESILEFAESRNYSLLAAVFGLLSFAFLWGYYVFFELLWNGQSPGKRLVGLRVIQQNGIPIDSSAALIRNLVRVVDFLPLYYGIGVLSMFVDRQSRRLGDLAAGTLVVYDQGTVTLQDLSEEASQLERSLQLAPLHKIQGQTSFPTHRVQPKHVTLARSFLGRQHEFYNRAELATFLARRILTDLDVPSGTLDEERAIALLKRIAGRNMRPANDLDSS